MKKQKTKKEIPSLPFPEVLADPREGPWGEKPSLRVTGKLGDAPPLAFSVSLPLVPCEETMAYLKRLRQAFFRHLVSESRRGRERVWFQGLDYSFSGRTLLFYHTLGPFDERRRERVCAIALTEDGRIRRILKKWPPSPKKAKRKQSK